MKKLGQGEKLENRTANLGAALDLKGGPGIGAKPPVTMPGQLGAFRDKAAEWQARIDKLEAELAERGSKQLFNVQLTQIVEISGRRRVLDDTAFAHLRENLRANDLVTPITVRELPSGKFEIISGHNRVRAYRELGRPTIQAVIQNTDDLKSGINAFYANLLQTDLTDYEKFQGFDMLREQLGLTQAAIASHSGMSESFVSHLMAFEDLPRDVLQIVARNPSILGMGAAYKLAGIAKKMPSLSHQITEAVGRLERGEIDQNEAVRLASRKDVDAAPKTKVVPIKIKSGKSTYCDMRRVDKTLRIQFKSAAEAEAVEDAIRRVLQNRAESTK